jgi:hypothetical protein
LSIDVAVQGNPIGGVRVSVRKEGAGLAGTGETDQNGNVIVNGLFPGSYTISASYLDMATLKLEAPCIVPTGGMGTAFLSLNGFRNELRVLDAEGKPLPDTNVSLDSPTMSASFTTDKDGRASPLLALGDYTASFNSYDSETKVFTQLIGTVSWPSAEGEEVELRLVPR